jgi:hypothetical protein
VRQGLFAILLIIAAFSGGALVNGPGLEWGRQHLASLSKHLPKQLAGNEDPLEDESQAEESEHPDSLDAGDTNARSPAARFSLPVADSSPFAPSSLSAENAAARDFPPPDDPGDEGAPTVKAPLGPTIATQASPLDAASPDTSSTSPRAIPAAPPSLLDLARRKLSDRGFEELPAQGAAEGDTSAVPQGSSPEVASSPPSEPLQSEASKASAAVSETFPPTGDEASPGEDRPQAPAIDPSIRLASRTSETQERADWAEVRAQMEDLGVGRYWVEGEFGGPVTFRCVVPMIGDRAVSQHFEAEGDDLITAARVTLRRIALWRATEETP